MLLALQLASARSRAALSLDTGFAPAFRGGGGYVHTVERQPDDTWLVAGLFAFVDGQPRNCVARLGADGTLDPTFDVGSGPNESVTVIRRQADRKVLVGGAFSAFAGRPAMRVVRCNADGSVDASCQRSGRCFVHTGAGRQWRRYTPGPDRRGAAR
jgi:hypothetical protein